MEKRNHPHLISASARGMEGGIDRLDCRVAHQWVVGVRLCIRDVSGILSDGILDKDTVRTTVVMNLTVIEHTVRPFPTPSTLSLMGIPESFPAAMAAF